MIKDVIYIFVYTKTQNYLKMNTLLIYDCTWAILMKIILKGGLFIIK